MSGIASAAAEDELTALASIYESDRITATRNADGSILIRAIVSPEWFSEGDATAFVLAVDLEWAVHAVSGKCGTDGAAVLATHLAEPTLRRASSAHHESEGDGDVSDSPRLRVLLLQHLAPLLVEIMLPTTYPATSPPGVCMSAPWLSERAGQKLAAHAPLIWAELGNEPCVYSYLEWLRTDSLASLLDVTSDTVTSVPTLSWGASNGGTRPRPELAYAVLLRGISSDRVKFIPSAHGPDAEEAFIAAEGRVRALLAGAPARSAGEAAEIPDVKCLLVGGEAWVPSDPRFRSSAGMRAVTANLSQLAAIVHDLMEYNQRESARRWCCAEFVCRVCLETRRGVECHRMADCRHVFCRHCLRAAVAATIADRSAGDAVGRLKRAGACLDVACHGSMSGPELRALCTEAAEPADEDVMAGAASRKATPGGATTIARSGAATSSAYADLQAALTSLEAEADAAALSAAAVRVAAGGVDAGDVLTIPCPRPKCGKPAVLESTRDHSTQLLRTQWGTGCIVFCGSPGALVAAAPRGYPLPTLGRALLAELSDWATRARSDNLKETVRFSSRSRRMAICTGCDLAFCADCQRSWHGGEACNFNISSPQDVVRQVMRVQECCPLPTAAVIKILLPRSEPPAGFADGSSGLSPGAGAKASKFDSERAHTTTRIGAAAGRQGERRSLTRKGLQLALASEVFDGAGVWSMSSSSLPADVQDRIKEAVALAQRTRRCPVCGVLIERAEGCRHMCCSMCRTPFCWDCGNARDSGAYYLTTPLGACDCDTGVPSRTVEPTAADVIDILRLS